jgi:hypothetical protein
MRYGTLLASIRTSGRFNRGPNVPRGVRTIAEGEGLFKQTEVTRYSAMTEADIVELLRRYPKIGASCNLYHRLSISRT